MNKDARFTDWKYPDIQEGKPTKYNWVVQNKDNLEPGYKTDIRALGQAIRLAQ